MELLILCFHGRGWVVGAACCWQNRCCGLCATFSQQRQYQWLPGAGILVVQQQCHPIAAKQRQSSAVEAWQQQPATIAAQQCKRAFPACWRSDRRPVVEELARWQRTHGDV